MSRPIQHLEAEIVGPARAWPRTKVAMPGGKVRRYNPRAYADWKTENAEKLRAFAGYRTFSGEISVAVDVRPDGYTVRIAALDPGDERRPTSLTGDIDNYAKAILDALQEGNVITNDNQVTDLTVRFIPERKTR